MVDEDLPAHRAYAEVVERLRSARAVLVIWSLDTSKSEWVRAEADAARHMHKLVQLSIDGALPANALQPDPMPATDELEWRGG